VDHPGELICATEGWLEPPETWQIASAIEAASAVVGATIMESELRHEAGRFLLDMAKQLTTMTVRVPKGDE